MTRSTSSSSTPAAAASRRWMAVAEIEIPVASGSRPSTAAESLPPPMGTSGRRQVSGRGGGGVARGGGDLGLDGGGQGHVEPVGVGELPQSLVVGASADLEDCG